MNYIFVGLIFFIIVVQIIVWGLIRHKNKKDYIRAIDMTLLFSIISLFCSAIYISTRRTLLAEITYNLGFIALDGIVLGLFSFTKKFAEYKKNMRIANSIYYAAVTIDVLLFISNLFYKEIFTIELKTISDNGFYWSLHLKPLIAFNFLMNSIVLIFTIYMLILKVKSVPSFYKNIYKVFIVPYSIAAILCYTSFFLDLKINLTFFFYGFLSYIFFHYNIYKADVIIREITIKNIIKNFPVATCWFNKEDNIVFKNLQAEALFKQELKWTDNQIKLFYTKFMANNHARTLDTAVSRQTFTINGKECIYEIAYQKLFNELDYIGSYLNFKDITKEIEKNKQSYILANYDSLTGIYNRERFFEVADEQIRNNPEAKWLMICTNIKELRLVNDLFGVEKGDEILKHLAQYIKERAMENEVYGHIVDDKFAVLMLQENYTDNFFEPGILDIIKVTDNHYFHIDYNIGIYESSNVIESSSYMYDKALMALDNLPEDSTENVVYYNESIMHTYLDDRAVVSDFNYGFNNNHFYMYLQPIFNREKKLIGAEALTRWNKPGSGLLLPEQFIYLFERAGLIYKLDMYIWEKAAQKLQYWKKMGYPDLFISINISINDIFYFDVYEYLCGLVEKYSINPKNIKLGIKESVLISDYGKGISLFKKFKEKGFDIEIDDFGSRYCSLNVLKDVDADYLRINLQSMGGIRSGETGKIIIQSIVSLARELDILVIGDNIETQEQFDFLKKIGCGIYQGYFFSKALQDKAFDQMYIQ